MKLEVKIETNNSGNTIENFSEYGTEALKVMSKKYVEELSELSCFTHPSARFDLHLDLVNDKPSVMIFLCCRIFGQRVQSVLDKKKLIAHITYIKPIDTPIQN
jgi:hypothetical protein